MSVVLFYVILAIIFVVGLVLALNANVVFGGVLMVLAIIGLIFTAIQKYQNDHPDA